MEPWLDSLSEDWKSEHNSSSLSLPHPTPQLARNGSIVSNTYQSRIPHLAQSHSTSKTNGKYLRSRSLRETPPLKGSAVLVEQNAFKLNVSAQTCMTATSESQRKLRTTTLPRRASTALSESAQSVQHYTLRNRSTGGLEDDDIPEWKRRLARGEDIAGDGCDLFGPSRLEGIFRAPPVPQDENQDPTSSLFEHPRLWLTSPNASARSTCDQFHSMKASRSKLLGLDIVEEVNEEAEIANASHESCEAAAPKGFLCGCLKQRVDSFEVSDSIRSQMPGLQPDIMNPPADTDLKGLQEDHRIRTTSGQEELKNEWISPITLSKQNTIRDRALKDSLDKSTAVLQARLEQLGIHDSLRPFSRSSDRGGVYGRNTSSGNESVYDETGADLTSHSLPDDLSMGTHDFISRSGFINKQRGGFSDEGSFHRKTMSSSSSSSYRGKSRQLTSSISQSSPLLPVTIHRKSHDRHSPNATSPMTSPASELPKYDKQTSVGSPLKLFGNRDTYTNNKLLRVLSHFEDTGSARGADSISRESVNNRLEDEFRMSQFGQGELDHYDFVEEAKLNILDAAKCDDLDGHVLASLEDSDIFKDRLSSAAGTKRNAKFAVASNPGTYKVENTDTDQTKRSPTSPLKERTPKRRCTLPRREIEISRHRQPNDDFVVPHNGSSKLAGTKRKDARYDDAAPIIDPESLAARQMLRPRMSRQRTLNRVLNVNTSTPQMNSKVIAPRKPGSVAVQQAVAEELVHVAPEVRKTSVTTQDYMEEATKIMQMIRAKGKPKSSLASVEGPAEESELNPDGTFDLDGDEVSSGDEFSRPPSRNGGGDLREQHRQQQHDPRIASHLRKFKETDDLELLIETSVLEPISVPDNAQAQEAALVPIPEDEQRSSPPNIRIRDNLDMQRKRKHSRSTTEDLDASQPHIVSMHCSSSNSTQRTVPTSSTGSSGRKGVINPGKVHIPDQVGAMTFDHVTKTWVRDRDAVNLPEIDRRARQATSEEDPFEHISDLSTEELHDTERDNESQASNMSRPSTGGSSSRNEHGTSAKINCEIPEKNLGNAQTMTRWHTTAQSQLIEHETRIHDERISRAPNSPEHVNKQPRVVTIAFSSPLVSAVAYQDDPSTSELEVNLTTRVSEGSGQIRGTRNGKPSANGLPKQGTATSEQSGPNSSYKSWPAQNFVRRPVSRIEEHDEVAANEDMSLIPTSISQAMTPVPCRSESLLALPNTAGKTSSIIFLTPLSEFSLHQDDKSSYEEASFVAQRRHRGALRQAHGSLALSVDDMMKAITDVEPFEPYWDHIRRLDLTGKRLTTLHRLEEYCSTLEELTINTNELRQLSGVPLSVRTLDVQKNCLSNMTSWGHLQNLQYLNISGNELESLQGLSCLYHLRELNASDNKISDIDGILDLNGLQCLKLQGNELEILDFEGGELTRLTRLDASRNQLAHVRSLSWLPALGDLNLEQNNLSEFTSSDTAPLVSLRHLRISTNKIRCIDLSACPNIESLYLDRNKVTEVRSLDHARHLHTLSIREQTDSPDIVSHVLSTSNDCRKIFLSSNAVPGGKLRLSTKPLFSLRYLELASCGITSMVAGFGTKFPNCRVLNMNFNAVGCIGRLQGMLHLNKLLLAGNRLERLRRSCLALSRHPALVKVDLRNNPLTVGFYSPAPLEHRLVVRHSSESGLPIFQDPYALPRQIRDVDDKWIRILDEGTRLRRRTIELLLAQNCMDLAELDGLAFDRDVVLQTDELWEALTGLGVLKRPMLLSQKSILAQGEDMTARDHVRIGTMDEERSFMVE